MIGVSGADWTPEPEADRGGDRRRSADKDRDVAGRLPKGLLAPEFDVGFQKLLSELFFFIIGHSADTTCN